MAFLDPESSLCDANDENYTPFLDEQTEIETIDDD